MLFERFKSSSTTNQYVEVLVVGGEEPAPAAPKNVAKDVEVVVSSPSSMGKLMRLMGR